MASPEPNQSGGDPPTDPTTLTVLAAMFACFALGIGGYGTYTLLGTDQMADWPTTTGTVVEMEHKVHFPDQGNKREYKIKGKVAYQVAGRDLIHVFRFSGAQGGYSTARAYSQGTTVTVHYNPDAPEEATIDPPLAGVGYFLIFLAAIPLGVAVFLFIKARRRRRNWPA